MDRVFIFLRMESTGVHIQGLTVSVDICLLTWPKMRHAADSQRLLADHVLQPVLLRPRSSDFCRDRIQYEQSGGDEREGPYG